MTVTSRKAVQKLQDSWITISIELDVLHVYFITLVLSLRFFEDVSVVKKYEEWQRLTIVMFMIVLDFFLLPIRLANLENCFL